MTSLLREQGDCACVCGDRGPITACPVHGRLALDLAVELAGHSASEDVVPQKRWTCPVCPHPSPGRYTHMQWTMDGDTACPTTRECPGRARAHVVSIVVPLPLPESAMERAFRTLSGRGVGGTDDWRRGLAQDVLAAALGQEGSGS